jgi:hypothetical protein
MTVRDLNIFLRSWWARVRYLDSGEAIPPATQATIHRVDRDGGVERVSVVIDAPATKNRRQGS